MVKNNESKMIEEKDVDTVLAEDIDFSGTMKFKNSLMIRGSLMGKLMQKGISYLDQTLKLKQLLERE